VLRPPGAIDEESFLAACTRCSACVTACPHDAVTLAPPRLRGAAGTPTIDPLRAPCRMCPDTPCITACEPRALRPDQPLKMGTAVISPLTCLAHQNSPCSACVEHCPVPGALSLVDGRPAVNADACTGCGVCQYVCPAPQNAVLILPLKDRATRFAGTPAGRLGDL
jgi:ferredoxin-type protein NapG